MNNLAEVLRENSRAPIKVEGVDLPQLRFEKTRWATTREDNVEKTAQFWLDNPNCVRVFEDSKFRKHQVVMMRKDALDRVLTLMHDLLSGQVGVKVEVDVIREAVQSLEAVLEENKDEYKGPIVHIVRLLSICIGRASATLVLARPKKTVAPTALTEQEIEELMREEEEEEEEGEQG